MIIIFKSASYLIECNGFYHIIFTSMYELVCKLFVQFLNLIVTYTHWPLF